MLDNKYNVQNGQKESTSTSVFWLVFSFAAVFGGLVVLALCLYIGTNPALMQMLDSM